MAENSAISWTDHTHPGPAPMPPREGDKVQARQRINVEVRSGRRRHPNSLPCVDCQHIWIKGERRHEYDHHLGYAVEHHYVVEAVCTTCHALRDNANRAKDTCVNGHLYTAETTGFHADGRRHCLECRRIRDRNRRDAAWWRNRRAKRRQANG